MVIHDKKELTDLKSIEFPEDWIVKSYLDSQIDTSKSSSTGSISSFFDSLLGFLGISHSNSFCSDEPTPIGKKRKLIN